MPTMTYTPLANLTLGSAASSVTFSSIPTTYRDLILILNPTTSADGHVTARFNGDTGTNYGYVDMVGVVSTAASSNGTFNLAYLMGNGAETNSPFFVEMDIMDYAATDKHKTMLVRSGTMLNENGTSGVYTSAHRWANTSAITSVVINTAAGTFNVGSTFALYAIVS